MCGSTIGKARTAPPVWVHLKDHLYCAWRPQSLEAGAGQWVTKAPPNQTGPRNTSSLAQTPALGPPLLQKHSNGLIMDSGTARLTSYITWLSSTKF
jgi:hypothetical protein